MKKLILISLLLTAACGQPTSYSFYKPTLTCTVSQTGLLSCPDGTSLQLNTLSIQPFCPAVPGAIGYANRESYLILSGQVYAVYADGTHTFLTLLNPGAYRTTDGRNCNFIVTTEGQVL